MSRKVDVAGNLARNGNLQRECRCPNSWAAFVFLGPFLVPELCFKGAKGLKIHHSKQEHAGTTGLPRSSIRPGSRE